MDISPSPTIQYQVLVVAAGLTFLAGFLINVFIVVVNICEWKKGKPVSETDKVITSLGISRMLFQGLCLVHIITDTSFLTLDTTIFLCIWFLEFMSTYCNIWLSALLSVVFCLKISTLHNDFFLRLKTLVLNRIFHLIMAILVMSISYALAASLIVNINLSYNSTQETYDNVMFGFEISVIILLSTGPFLFYFTSSVLLIISLYHHINRMKSERSGTNHLDTYWKTIKFIGFSLLCSFFNVMLDNTYRYCLDAFGTLGLYFFWQIFPTFHSIYVVYATVKLQSQVSNMVRLLKRGCPDPETRVETVSQ